MTTVPLSAGDRATPGWRDVLREQLRVIALSLRVPTMIGGGLLALATVLGIADFVRLGVSVDFRPELSMVPGMVGLLLPVGVWFGESRFGTGFPWTLPVDRRTLVLTRVAAGWLWLMAATLLFLLWLLTLALVTRGEVLPGELMRLLPTPMPAEGSVVDPASLGTARWAPGPVIWLVPFTAATGAYVLASAFALGTRSPMRWLVGVVLGALLMSLTGVAAAADWLKLGPANALETVLFGSYGFDALLTARTESLRTLATIPGGERITVWKEAPSLLRWGTATLLWTAGGLLLLWVAAARHRERRRA